jgi:hypothetical protein
MCRLKYLHAGQGSYVLARGIYRRGGAIPAVWFKSPGKGSVRGLADVLDPPQNVGQSQLMRRVPGRVHGPAHLANLM